MTEAKVKPGQDEVAAMAQLLANIDAKSKHDLRHYLAGTTDWRMALRIIKRCIQRIVNDSQARVRRDQRIQLLEFASRYGLKVGNTLADEPMTEMVRFMMTPTQKDEVLAAAAAAGHDLSTWGRDTLLREARAGRVG